MISLRSLVLATILAVAYGEGCSICGMGMVVTIPDNNYTFPENPIVTCGELQTIGMNGTLDDATCASLRPLISTLCGCAPSPAPTAAPVPSASPTSSPTTTNPKGMMTKKVMKKKGIGAKERQTIQK